VAETPPLPAGPVPAVPPRSARPRRPRVVAAAVEPVRRAAVVEKLNQVVAAGGSALIITADGGADLADLAPDVETLDLTSGERKLGVNRLLVANPVRLVGRLTGRSLPSGVSPLWARLTASKPYRLARPWLLWRVLRRRLAQVRVGDVDHVIIVHPNSWPIAWQLHRRNPAVTISYEVPDEVWQRAGRPVPGREPTRS
jgi:hypothetical protein